MGERPSGTVTFLFTDIEGSTRLWEERRAEMEQALAEHDAIVRGAIASHDGYVFATGGDGFAAAFARAGDAVAAAEEAQKGLGAHPFVRVRMGLHTGEVQERDGDYFGPAVNQAARIMDAGHGGQVLLSEVSAALVEADCVDLGEYSLSGISGVVSIRQLGTGDFPALRAGAGAAVNLPVYRTSLIGREELLASVCSMLRAGSLVTLTGVGGVGKTRVAVELAGRVSQDFPDGVRFVGLSQLGDGSALPITVLSELGLEGGGANPLDVLCAVVGSNRMLLVLDNCEHLIEDAAELVEDLLDRCDGLTVLATSREGLAVAGEHLVAVPPLSGKAAESGANSERVRMLIDRALAANPGMVTTAADEEALQTIADELDGVPLAIELAAARLAALTPVQVAERLGDRFRLLTGGRRSRERHQTLRATVQWSYDLLDDTSKRLFDELSVFSDGFTLELALLLAADLDEVEAIETLEDLVQKSMVIFDPTDGPGRYRMLMTLRQFGQDNVDASGEADDVRSRWTDALDRYVARLCEGLTGDTELVNRRAIQAEMSNIASACEWAISGGEVEAAAHILSRSFYEITMASRTRLLELAKQIRPLLPEGSASYPGVLALTGWAMMNTGDVSAADEWFARADRVRDGLPLTDRLKLIWAGAAIQAASARHSDGAEMIVAEAERAAGAGDAETEAVMLGMLPFYLTSVNRHEESVAVGRTAVEKAGAVESEAWRASAAVGLGYALAWTGSTEAIPLLQGAVPTLKAHGFAHFETVADRALAHVITTTGDHREAARLLLHALDEAVAARSIMYQNVVLFYAARLLVYQERWGDAALALGGADNRLGFLITPSYEMVRQEITDKVAANLGEEAVSELRSAGAAMSDEQLVAWGRTTLESLADSGG